jgi:anaerobic magnesium-protoporphyrin IX monomethyl ester cyclase
MTIDVQDHRILIAHAFFLKNDDKQHKEKYKPYPPLAALYAAAILRDQEYQVSLFDAVLEENTDAFCRAYEEIEPSLVIFYEDDFNFLTKMCLDHVRQATLKMIARVKVDQSTVIVHSSDAVDHPDIYLSHGADYIIHGEGEHTLKALVDFCFAKSNLLKEEIEGIYYLSRDGVKKTGQRTNVKRLDELPRPAWDLVDFEKYRAAWQSKHGYYSLNLVTTRGCPYKCNWCAKPIWGQQYSSHSPEYIADQLEWLVLNASPDHIWFADDIFGLKRGWIERFSAIVNERQIQVPFMIQSRADLIDKTVARALKVAGCDEVWLGVESGSQQVLDNMDKGITLAEIEMARLHLKDNGINVGFFIQLGYLGEDIHDIEQTREMILELRPDKIGVSVSYPLPGTLFYEKVKADIREKTNWQESNDLDTVFRSTYKADYYRLIRKHLHEELKDCAKAVKRLQWESKWQQLVLLAEQYKSSTTEINVKLVDD